MFPKDPAKDQGPRISEIIMGAATLIVGFAPPPNPLTSHNFTDPSSLDILLIFNCNDFVWTISLSRVFFIFSGSMIWLDLNQFPLCHWADCIWRTSKGIIVEPVKHICKWTWSRMDPLYVVASCHISPSPYFSRSRTSLILSIISS